MIFKYCRQAVSACLQSPVAPQTYKGTMANRQAKAARVMMNARKGAL